MVVLRPDGKPTCGIGFGMGIERVAALLQGTNDNYATDLMRALIEASALINASLDLPATLQAIAVAAAEVLNADECGNVARGRTLELDTEGSILVGDGVAVAAVGVRDLVVVATPDAVLVVPKNEAQRVKEVVDTIRERGWDDVL